MKACSHHELRRRDDCLYLSLSPFLPPIEPEPRRRPPIRSLFLFAPLLSSPRSVQIKQNRLTNERGEDNAAAAGRECSVGLGDRRELLHDVDGHLFRTLVNIVPDKLRTLENRTKVTQV